MVGPMSNLATAGCPRQMAKKGINQKKISPKTIGGKFMTTAAGVKRTAEQVLGQDKIVSSDSHIMEPEDLWLKNLTPSLAAKFPKFPPRNTAGEKPGGHDPKARLDEMAVDGVS